MARILSPQKFAVGFFHTQGVGAHLRAVLAALFLSLCLTTAPVLADTADADVETVDTGDISDPLESLNRVLFFVHDGLDTLIIRPVVLTYRTIVPKPIRSGVRNFISNVATPVTLTNDLLQGEWERAGTTTKRFLINSTMGLGGLVDYAQTQGLEKHKEDFGQTLAVHGVGSGPYIFVPLLGPGTPRHLVGRVVDLFLDPWTYILYNETQLIQTAPFATLALTSRANGERALQSVKETSVDYYASIRSLYYQSRRDAISNGNINDEDLVDIPGFDSE